MSFGRIILLASACIGAAACASPQNTVYFATSTSFGINVEKTPPSAAVAYDRTEAYVAPRTSNGALPPVVGSFQSGGNFFNPQVRQVYATGAASVLVGGGSDHGPPAMTGDERDDKVAFFGTTTTIGLKVGFDADGPNTLVFGFKRKELSIIPLGTGDRNERVYPSVLASIDTTLATKDFQDSGLSINQYFATGAAAETLAASGPIRKIFGVAAVNAASATLTPDQKAAAQATATAVLGQQATDLDKVMNDVAPGGVLNKSELAAVIAKANALSPASVNTNLNDATSADELRSWIAGNPAVTAKLAAAIGN
ncbi:MAG: hypothetical protein WDM86_15235 [Rhizomicrobium sp.]